VRAKRRAVDADVMAILKPYIERIVRHQEALGAEQSHMAAILSVKYKDFRDQKVTFENGYLIPTEDS